MKMAGKVAVAILSVRHKGSTSRKIQHSENFYVSSRIVCLLCFKIRPTLQENMRGCVFFIVGSRTQGVTCMGLQTNFAIDHGPASIEYVDSKRQRLFLGPCH